MRSGTSTSSWIARLAVPSGIAYSASKGAVETMTRTWAAVYLASDDAAFVHGSKLDVDGGRQHVAVLAGQN